MFCFVLGKFLFIHAFTAFQLGTCQNVYFCFTDKLWGFKLMSYVLHKKVIYLLYLKSINKCSKLHYSSIILLFQKTNNFPVVLILSMLPCTVSLCCQPLSTWSGFQTKSPMGHPNPQQKWEEKEQLQRHCCIIVTHQNKSKCTSWMNCKMMSRWWTPWSASIDTSSGYTWWSSSDSCSTTGGGECTELMSGSRSLALFHCNLQHPWVHAWVTNFTHLLFC